MRNCYSFPTIILAGAAFTACSMQPEKNLTLDAARNSYGEAQSDPDVNTLASIEMQQATKALDKANEAQRKREDRKEVDHLSYLAKQQVAIAQETAKLRAAELTIANAGVERDKVRLEARTAEADTAKQGMAAAQKTAEQQTNDLAVAHADIERGNRELETKTAESEALAKKQAESSEIASSQAAELSAANAKISQIETELKDLNAKQTEHGLVITLGGDVLFDTNKTELRQGGTHNLQKLADFFKKYPKRKALIEGFTDSTGDSNYNQGLSDRRANTVRDTLIQMGISGERVSTRGYGEENPVASNETAAGRQLNRRVEIVISDENGVIALQ